LAYGQTGAGKTFTMSGATEFYNDRGMIPRALGHLFKEICDRKDFEISVRLANFLFCQLSPIFISAMIVHVSPIFILTLVHVSPIISTHFFS